MVSQNFSVKISLKKHLRITLSLEQVGFLVILEITSLKQCLIIRQRTH